MRVLKINNRDYVLKFTSKSIQELNAQDITLTALIDDLQTMKVDKLYTTFMYGLKTMQPDMTMDKALDILDQYYEEDENNDLEVFFTLVIEEYSKAMGLGKKFMETMAQQKAEPVQQKE